MSGIRFALSVSLVALSIGFAALDARAQDSGLDGDDISLYIGSMLPNQIDGVSEILPVFGGRYGFDTTMGTFEVGGANTHAEGVDFTTMSGSLRGDFDLGDGMRGLIYGGIDANWYIPAGQTDRKAETGFHIGTGAMMHIASTLWLRSDLKFMGGPGTSLYLLFGVLFKAPTF